MRHAGLWYFSFKRLKDQNWKISSSKTCYESGCRETNVLQGPRGGAWHLLTPLIVRRIGACTHALARALESKVMTMQASMLSQGATRVSGVSDGEAHSLMEVLKVAAVVVSVCLCACVLLMGAAVGASAHRSPLDWRADKCDRRLDIEEALASVIQRCRRVRAWAVMRLSCPSPPFNTPPPPSNRQRGDLNLLASPAAPERKIECSALHL